MTPKTSAQRTAKHRAGLVAPRWELSPPPHPGDRLAIKEFAAKLARKRAKLAARVPANNMFSGAPCQID